MDANQRMKLTKSKIDSMAGLPDVSMAKGVATAGDAMTGFVDFNWKLIRDRETKNLTLYVEWVDIDGTGNRVVLPHAVVQATRNAYDRLVSKSRSIAAKQAIQTRKEKGTYKPPVPPRKIDAKL